MPQHRRSAHSVALGMLFFVALQAGAENTGFTYYSIGPSQEERQNFPEHDIQFGSSVSIDGHTAVATMPGIDRIGVFDFRNGAWIRTHTILPTIDFDVDGTFGTTLDLDHQRLVIGSTRRFGAAQVSALHVYRRGPKVWREIASTQLRSERYAFGSNVEHDRNYVVVGVRRTDVSPSPEPGAVYVYALREAVSDASAATDVADSTQTKKYVLRRSAVLRADDGVPNDGFGNSVALQWPFLVVGAPGVDAVYVFLHVAGTWMQIDKLTSSAGSGVRFGGSVDIRNGVILVGASGVNLPGEVEPGGEPEGDAYVFVPGRTGWVQKQALNTSTYPFFSSFGATVALGDGLLAVNTPTSVGASWSSGNVIVFERKDGLFSGGQSVSSIQGIAGVDLDMSGRWLIAGMRQSSRLTPRILGRADILYFAPSGAQESSQPGEDSQNASEE